MSIREGASFFAWCGEGEKVDAFAAALSALYSPAWPCRFSLDTLDVREHFYRSGLSADDVIALMRAKFTTKSLVRVCVALPVPSGGVVSLDLECRARGSFLDRYPFDPLVANSGGAEFYSCFLDIAHADGSRSIFVEAAIMSILIREDIEEILLRMCAPNENNRRITGGASDSASDWRAPLEIGATYNDDGIVARDMALSWIHLHDGDLVGFVAGMSLDELRARIEVAPRGATVGVATKLDGVDDHILPEREAAHHPATRGTHVGALRRVPRERLPGDVDLTREQVLRVLETPPATLLDALEAAAVPDDDWRAVEPRALEIIEAKKQRGPTFEVDMPTAHHRRFIEQHAPYHVRRLPNGGVLLATHPYRTLWQLWADALLLLGIRA